MPLMTITILGTVSQVATRLGRDGGVTSAVSLSPAVPGAAPAQFGPTAALDLLRALSDLRSAQDAFMSVWLNYYAGRMTLMRELGLMEIDENGLWVDVPLEEALAAAPSGCPLPPNVPQQWRDEYAIPPSPRADGDAPADGKPSPPRLQVPPPPTPAPVIRESEETSDIQQ